jgi:hypothetical protein
VDGGGTTVSLFFVVAIAILISSLIMCRMDEWI